MKKPIGSFVIVGLKILLSAIVLYLLFTVVTPAEIAATFHDAEAGWVIAAIALIPVQVAFRSFRWRVLLRSGDVSVTLRAATDVVLMGHAFSSVTPAEIGDFVARVNLRGATSRSLVVALTIADKVCHSAGVLTLGLPSLIFLLTAQAFWALGVLVFLCVLWWTVYRFRSATEFLLRIVPTGIRGMIERVIGSLIAVPTNAIVRAGLLTGATLIVFAVQEYTLLRSVTTVGMVDAWNGFWSGMAVRSVFPFFLGDLGIREATHIYFFGRVGVPANEALSVSLMMFAVNTVTPAIAGLVVFLRRPSPNPS